MVTRNFTLPPRPQPVKSPPAPPMSAGLAKRVIFWPLPIRFPPPQPTGPLAKSQQGSLFLDNSTKAVRWYLPTFALCNDPDPAFTFAASQQGVDGSGNPLCSVSVAFSAFKEMPPDAAAFKAANPNVQLNEIPLRDVSATLTLAYKDATTGAAQTLNIAAAVTLAANGIFRISVAALVGSPVLILYQELAKFGGTSVTISAAYDVWATQASPPHYVPVRMVMAPAPGLANVPPPAMRTPATSLRPAIRVLPPSPASRAPAPVPDVPVYQPRRIEMMIPLGQKFGADIYQLEFTITEGGKTRTILSVDDLKSFDAPQSEFIPLKSLGSIPAKYPSLNALYLGVLSRVIVCVPARYGIVRGKDSCAASCLALLDSASSTAGACKFQFTFLLAPNLSAVEMLELAQEIASHPELKDCTLTLPEFLDNQLSASLQTAFVSNMKASRGIEQHTVALSMEVVDAGTAAPAVANANLFLSQIAQSQAPYLTGALSANLDAGGNTLVSSVIVLNFEFTSADAEASDGLSFALDAATSQVSFKNDSVFSLQLSRLANGMEIVPLNATLTNGQSFVPPLGATPPATQIAVDRELFLPNPMSKSALMTYIQFRTQDVENVRYLIGINASGVAFDAHSLSTISVMVSISQLPQIQIPTLSLHKLNTLDSANIVIPLQYAISAVSATLSFTLTFTDPTKSPVEFTRDADLLNTPIFVLADADIVANLPRAAAN